MKAHKNNTINFYFHPGVNSDGNSNANVSYIIAPQIHIQNLVQHEKEKSFISKLTAHAVDSIVSVVKRWVGL